MLKALLALSLATFFANQQAHALAQIDENQGCRPYVRDDPQNLSKLNALEFAKQENCRDFTDDYWRNPTFAAAKSGSVTNAEQSCVQFFTLAHKLQNTFCSYYTDVKAFAGRAQAVASQANAGNADKSQADESKILAETLTLHKEYLAKLNQLGPAFHETSVQYLSRLGQMNSVGMANEGMEASYCTASAIDSPIPGKILQALASVSGGSAAVTFRSMYEDFTRKYLHLFQALSQDAGAKKFLADLKLNNIGEYKPGKIDVSAGAHSFGQSAPGEKVDPGPLEGVTKQVVQNYLTDTLKKYAPKLGGAGASIIGGGAIAIYDYVTNKKVIWSDRAVTFVGMVSPTGGIVAAFFLAANRDAMHKLGVYQSLAERSLAKNYNLTSYQLVALHSQELAKSNKSFGENCFQKIQAKVACLSQNPLQQYSHPCN